MTKSIFMIHGMWGGPWHWDKFRGYFTEKGYKCITPALRYHDVGPDEPIPDGLGTTSLLDYADDLEAAIRKLDTKPIIMGHSMGGLLAQILTSRGLAEKAVFIVPVAPAGILTFEPSVYRSLQGIILKWDFWGKPHKLTYERATYALMHKLPQEERDYIYSRAISESGRAMAEICYGSLGVDGSQVDSSKVNCPVLVVSASEDRVTPASMIKKIAKKYQPHSTYLEFSGHAHWITREPGWEMVADRIIEWL
tara:strand:- start:3163 stop:3915 length:753 start_codon:yes stop_codon:yes gene_type:complete